MIKIFNKLNSKTLLVVLVLSFGICGKVMASFLTPMAIEKLEEQHMLEMSEASNRYQETQERLLLEANKDIYGTMAEHEARLRDLSRLAEGQREALQLLERDQLMEREANKLSNDLVNNPNIKNALIQSDSGALREWENLNIKLDALTEELSEVRMADLSELMQELNTTKDDLIKATRGLQSELDYMRTRASSGYSATRQEVFAPMPLDGMLSLEGVGIDQHNLTPIPEVFEPYDPYAPPEELYPDESAPIIPNA